MDHKDHVALLKNGIEGSNGVWADFGAGDGAFTLALADLLESPGEIHVLDKSAHALQGNQTAMRQRFPHMPAQFQVADFTQPLQLPPLDGIIMANSLHFVRDKQPVLQQIMSLLKPGGRFILVEYESDRGNTWVPFPLSYGTWQPMATAAGFVNTRRLLLRPSRFLEGIYSALSFKPT